jgi:protein SCO1
MENAPTHATPPRIGISWIHFVFLALLVLTGLAGGVLMWLAKSRPPVGRSSVRPLPAYATITKHLSAPDRSGRTVSTAELEGKVWTVAYTYTRCPHGCLGVVANMMKLRDEFGSDPGFHQVSITLTPDSDTPQALEAFTSAQGIRPNDHWWFLSGDPKSVREFMTDQLHFTPSIETPPERRLSEFDRYQHDLRVGLIDSHGQLRGFYEIQNPDPATAALHLNRLGADIRRLLADVKK